MTVVVIFCLKDCEQIEPKRLPNPHKESKQHVRLNKEIKFNSARYISTYLLGMKVGN